jgi:hypothetical protein
MRGAGCVRPGYDPRAQPPATVRRSDASGLAGAVEVQQSEGGRWKLDKYLRCAGGIYSACTVVASGRMRILGSRRNLLDARRAGARGMGWEMRWLERVVQWLHTRGSSRERIPNE